MPDLKMCQTRSSKKWTKPKIQQAKNNYNAYTYIKLKNEQTKPNKINKKTNE